MARRVFFSFHFKNDYWRTQQVRNIGVIEGNKPVSANDWEEVKKKGDPAIERWIADNMSGKSCVIVLVGDETAKRKWVKYEIKKAWEDGKGVMGIRIHKLKHNDGSQSNAGDNPFSQFSIKVNGKDKCLDEIVKIYSRNSNDSQEVYNYIADNIENWVETAIEIRSEY